MKDSAKKTEKWGNGEKKKKERKDKKQFSYIYYLYIFTNLSIIFLTHFHILEIILVILTGRKIKRIHLQNAADFVFIFSIIFIRLPITKFNLTDFLENVSVKKNFEILIRYIHV